MRIIYSDNFITMAAKKTTKKKSAQTKKAVGIGVGVTAAMAAAAGAYFLYGSKNAAKNRKQVKSWMLKAKAEVLEGIENTKDMSQETYERLVDSAVAGYGRMKSVSNSELEALKKELKSHWKDLEKKGQTKKSAPKKTVTKKKPASRKKAKK